MTPIEDLVREALAATPTAPANTDPLAGLDRRVRRARRRLAVGACAVTAAVAAAIVVPLAVLGGNGKPNSVNIVNPPTPSPTASPPPGTTVLSSQGAVWISTDSDGHAWLLEQNPAISDQYYVAQVGPNGPGKGFNVPGPADYVVASDNVIWVVGAGVAGDDMSRLTAIDTRTGDVVTLALQHQYLSFAGAVDDGLYVDRTDATGGHVDLFELRSGDIESVQSTPVSSPGEIASSEKGHVWVRSDKKLVELIPKTDGFQSGATVEWPGEIYGPTGADSLGDSLWAYDGRIIGLTPKNLLGCLSCAEGWRINVAGPPTAVVTDKDGGLFAAVPEVTPEARQAGFEYGLYFYPAKLVHGAGAISGPSLKGAVARSLAADPAGGVDYVDDLGRLMHWDPAEESR